MAETNKKLLGIVGILSMLLGSIGTVVLTPDQLDHSYVCSVNEKVAVFDRISSTAKTGYWNDAGTEKSSTCTSGTWIPLKKYATDHNISIESLLNKPMPELSGWDCSKNNCYSCNEKKCEVIQ